jgi:YhcN/YlaJ family sporulation lipoprotein
MRYWIVMVLALSVMAGCGRGNNQPAPDASQNGNVRVQQTVPPKPQIKNRQEVAERLENLAKSIPQVKAARCVVLGNTAIVGIDVDPALERSRVDVIKYSVAEALRKDPYGVHAFVTADMDLNARIQEIAADVRRGRPVAGFAEELADIIGRIVPQIPKDITPQENPPSRSDGNPQVDNKQL